MEYAELQKELIDLIARNLAQREIIARLVAYVAGEADEPATILADFSVAGDARIDAYPALNEPSVAAAEVIRREKDLIVELARKILAAGEGPPN